MIRKNGDEIQVLSFPADEIGKYKYTGFLCTACAAQGANVMQYSNLKAAFGRADVVHLHWPEEVSQESGTWRAPVLRPLKFLIALVIAKARGVKVVWTVHNLRPHEVRRPRALRMFRAIFYRLVDAFVFLSEGSMRLFSDEHPKLRGRRMVVILHGHYRDLKTIRPIPDSPTARTRLGIGNREPCLLTIGLVRPYKNIPQLVRAFKEVAQADAALVVAGQVLPIEEMEEERRAIEEAAGQDPRIALHFAHVPDEMLGTYFAASDVMVLPYSNILNSGAALLALSFDTPVIAPRMGSLPELQESVGDDWLYLFEPPFSAGVLRDALAWLRNQRRAPAPPMDAFEWSGIAHRHVELYRELKGRAVADPVSGPGAAADVRKPKR